MEISQNLYPIYFDEEDSLQVQEFTQKISSKLEFLLRGTNEFTAFGHLTNDNLSLARIKLEDDISTDEETKLREDIEKARQLAD